MTSALFASCIILKGISKIQCKGSDYILFYCYNYFLLFLFAGCFMVVMHSTCSDSLSNVSFIFLNLVTATLLFSDFSGLCVILLYKVSVVVVQYWSHHCQVKLQGKKTCRFIFKCHFVKVAALVSFVNIKERLSSYCAVMNDWARWGKHHLQFDQTWTSLQVLSDSGEKFKGRGVDGVVWCDVGVGGGLLREDSCIGL